MEYIEKKQLMAFPIRRDHCDKKNADEHFINGIESVIEYAENLPTIDIIRCENCAWSDDDGCYEPFTWCNAYNFGVMDKTKHFCATGERRTE